MSLCLTRLLKHHPKWFTITPENNLSSPTSTLGINTHPDQTSTDLFDSHCANRHLFTPHAFTTNTNIPWLSQCDGKQPQSECVHSLITSSKKPEHFPLRNLSLLRIRRTNFHTLFFADHIKNVVRPLALVLHLDIPISAPLISSSSLTRHACHQLFSRACDFANFLPRTNNNTSNTNILRTLLALRKSTTTCSN